MTRRATARAIDRRPWEDVGSAGEVYRFTHRHPSEASPADLHRRAVTNLRRHLIRSVIRVAALLSVDLMAFLLLRVVLRSARETAIWGAPLHSVVNRFFGEGYLGGGQFACALIVGLLVMGCYGAGDRRRDARRLFLACALATALSLWSQLWSGSPVVALGRFAVTTVVFSLVLLAERLIVDVLVWRYYARPVSARTLLVGAAEDCLAMMRCGVLGERSGFKVVGFADIGTTCSPEARGPLSRLDAILHDDEIDTVVLCGDMNEFRFARIVRAAMAAECHVLSSTRSFEFAGVQPVVVWHRGFPLIELRGAVLRGQQLFLKRALDVVVSATVLTLALPLILIIALLIRLDSSGPIFFGQRRLGRHGRVFKCYKFRSMYADAEERLRKDPILHELYLQNDYKLPPHLDSRITRIGRLLRRTSLDELPQLFNVLRGEMSLVGPRPIVPDELRHYEHDEPLFLSLKPGVTGAWQVQGRSTIGYPERANLELEYIQRWSLPRDLEILFRTIPAVLIQRGAH